MFLWYLRNLFVASAVVLDSVVHGKVAQNKDLKMLAFSLFTPLVNIRLDCTNVNSAVHILLVELLIGQTY